MILDAKLDVIGIVVADMGKALAFYRMLGLDVPAGADDEPHVEAVLPGGLRLAFDTEATIASFHPEWKPGTGGRVGLAFALPDPAAVDAAYAQLIDGRPPQRAGAVRRVLGTALRDGPRPGRHRRRPVRAASGRRGGRLTADHTLSGAGTPRLGPSPPAQQVDGHSGVRPLGV